mmetsp:Transcript_49194/g.157309  ORF Transcript_49194/g.157309 Transcript_49194/m.157309 type:complete len:255 (-) Transcript_49194:532-1296(-)
MPAPSADRLVLHVNLPLRAVVDLAVAAARLAALHEGREPLGLEPRDRVLPALLEGDDGLVAEVALCTPEGKPAVHREHLHREGVELHLLAYKEPDCMAHVGEAPHEPQRQVELLEERPKAHADHRLVQLPPELAVALGVRVCRRVGADVELRQGRASLVEGPLTKDEPMAVVVDVREADPILPRAEDAQLPCGGCLQHVWQEKCVARPVDLVRRHGDGQELVAAGVREELLPGRLRGRVLLQVPLLRDGRHVGL